MSVYLKLFLAAAIPYAILMGLLFFSLPAGVAFGTGFGLVISTIFGTLQHSAYQGKKADGDRSVNQSRDIEIDVPLTEAFDLCLKALATLHRARVKKADPLSGLIEARTGINWKTYGEKVTFRLFRVDSHTTRIHLASRPRLKTALIDFGRNLYNINRLSVFLREASASDNLARDYRHLEIEEELPSLARLVESAEMTHEQARKGIR